jgi:hypothetical protein
MFEARLEARPSDSLVAEARPMHAFGLAKVMERRVDVKGDPEWTVFAPPRLEGEKAPAIAPQPNACCAWIRRSHAPRRAFSVAGLATGRCSGPGSRRQASCGSTGCTSEATGL